MVQFTDEQKDAAYSRGENLLVSAGAGSGKTTVLVERVVGLLAAGVEADRLLVLTFTRAAADEMRSRIERALRQRAGEEPALKRQLALLPQAQISTIHAFCMELLRRHHYQVGLPAGFRLANEAECDALARQVLDDILEEGYGREDGDIAALADAYGGPRDDRELVELILRLRDYSRSRPDPTAWLQQAAAQLHPEGKQDDTAGTVYLKERLRLDMELAESYFHSAASLSHRGSLPSSLLDLAAADMAACRQISAPPTLALRLTALSHLHLGVLPRGKKKLGDIAPELLDEYIRLRQAGRDVINEAKKSYPPPESRESQAATAALIHTLTQTVITLEQRFSEEKRNRGWVDYGDLEHLTYALLQDEPTAAQLAAGYDQILVDEYQDTNEVQEAILQRLRRPGCFFAVGDVKQSVYRFRLAEPALFLAKYRDWGQGKGGRRIDLNRNYRSSPTVIQAINSLFRQIMYREVAELDYDADAELQPGLDKEGVQPELWLLPPAGPHEDGGAKREARLLAVQALLLHQEGYAWGDMAVLLRSLQGRQEIIAQAFARAGIPCILPGQGEFRDCPEVLLTLSLLQVLDNPRQDIPLAATLRSSIGGFSDEELLELRLSSQQEGSLYQALENQATQPQGQAAQAFLRRLTAWRKLAAEQPLSALLPTVWRETGFYQMAGALPDGRSRQARLDLLQQWAGEQEALGGGLYGYLERIRQTLAPGQRQPVLPAETTADAVQVMTIHKSKGLEFPVVFVAGCGSRFNFRDEYADVVWERSLGLGARCPDRPHGQKYATLSHRAVTGKMHDQALAEEMRIYYVALTRAKERLILTAASIYMRKQVTEWLEFNDPSVKLPLYLTARASSPLDWFGPALLRKNSPAAADWQIKWCDYQDLFLMECALHITEFDPPAPCCQPEEPALLCVEEEPDAPDAEEEPAPLHTEEEPFSPPIPPFSPCYIPQPLPDDPAEEGPRATGSLPTTPAPLATNWIEGPAGASLSAILSWQYPYRQRCDQPAKWTVSALNRRLLSEEQLAEAVLLPAAQPQPEEAPAPFAPDSPGPTDSAPDFSARTGSAPDAAALDPAEQAARRGTVVHLLLQRLDFQHTSQPEIASQIQALVSQGLLTPADQALLHPDALSRWWDTPLARRLTAAQQVWRELPFTMLDEEGAVIQGVIDVLFFQDNRPILLDYKTGGRHSSEEEVLTRYQGQLRLYAQALSRLLNTPVAEAWLCLVDAARNIPVPLEP